MRCESGRERRSLFLDIPDDKPGKRTRVNSGKEESMRTLAVCIMCAWLVASASGCVPLVAGAAGGVGTAMWLQNKLVNEVEVPFDEAVDAAKSGLRDMDMEIKKFTETRNAAQLRSLTGADKQVWVDVIRVSHTTSRIEVRVGFAGGEDAARSIMERIEQSL
ncbi:MAG: DUF3568 family protein [Candidatus Omnitrophica bacterium]|nr:DUF3568 family protein [Candidatus Omnitrophota bacterium]